MKRFSKEVDIVDNVGKATSVKKSGPNNFFMTRRRTIDSESSSSNQITKTTTDRSTLDNALPTRCRFVSDDSTLNKAMQMDTSNDLKDLSLLQPKENGDETISPTDLSQLLHELSLLRTDNNSDKQESHQNQRNNPADEGNASQAESTTDQECQYPIPPSHQQRTFADDDTSDESVITKLLQELAHYAKKEESSDISEKGKGHGDIAKSSLHGIAVNKEGLDTEPKSQFTTKTNTAVARQYPVKQNKKQSGLPLSNSDCTEPTENADDVLNVITRGSSVKYWCKRRFRLLLIAGILGLMVSILVVAITVGVVSSRSSSSTNSKESLSSNGLDDTDPTGFATESKGVVTTSTTEESKTDSPILKSTMAPSSAKTSTESPVAAPIVLPPLPTPILITVNGHDTTSTLVDHDGLLWRKDAEFLMQNESSNSYHSPNTQCNAAISLQPNVRHSIYCTGRYMPLMYEIPVSDDRYGVTMHFLTTSKSVDASDWIVNIEGVHRTVIPNLSNTIQDDTEYSFTYSRDIRVRDGSLSITLDAGRHNNATTYVLTALEVHRSFISGGEDAVKQYQPGNLVVKEVGLVLSKGLTARIIATAGDSVLYSNGQLSELPFHTLPDAAECFPDTRPGRAGGWIYVSNSEAKPENRDAGTDQYPGGVGAITFDALGNILEYNMLLEDTRQNCGGGPTPWGAWISGEEYEGGRIWQVDPTGRRPAQRITMGDAFSGFFESFAYYIPSPDNAQFFMTKDQDESGDLRRFIPKNPNWEDPWSILLGEGSMDFLVVEPNGDGTGTYFWTDDWSLGERAAISYFPGSEGIDVVGDQLFFVSKWYRTMYILDLSSNTYTNQTTSDAPIKGSGGQPDQIIRLFDPLDADDSVLYFTQDGGEFAGISALTVAGECFTVLEDQNYSDETTGLSFSPDGHHMYMAYQDEGLLFDVTRIDKLPFHERTLDIKYHNVIARRRKGRRS